MNASAQKEAGDDEAVSAAIPEPRAPHDGFSFDQLASGYNYNLTSDRSCTLARLVMDEIRGRPQPVRVLDIGAGRGIGGDSQQSHQLVCAVGRAATEMWGVEPDPAVRPLAGAFHQYLRGTMESAALPEGYFDVAFSSFVMEHVEDPPAFMRALHRCLKPGGVYLFVTPNAHHYFTRAARIAKSLRADEWLVRALRGKELVEAYHYPVRYRFNDPKIIDACAADVGFDRPEYAYTECGGPWPYFPGPLRLIYWGFVLKRMLIRRPGSLLELFCRISKPK